MIYFLFVIFILYLLNEKISLVNARKKIKNIIYVNGIRGKSTVTRLIDSGLREAGYKVFSKTTGTIPMYINTNNEEVEIKRCGNANIKEQIKIIEMAAKEEPDFLVMECMATDPYLQYITESKMVNSTISVITNVRHDHLDVMGSTLEEICDSLSNTICKDGVLFTSESKLFDRLTKNAAVRNTKVFKSQRHNSTKKFFIPENYDLALEVMKYLNIDEETAINGMKKYKKDPYSLENIKFNNNVFINGLSINDPDSIIMIYNNYIKSDRKLTLIVNNRPDRGFRASQMVEVIYKINPDRLIITGAFKKYFKRYFKSAIIIKNIEEFENIVFDNENVFAIGNIAGVGENLISYFKGKSND